MGLYRAGWEVTGIDIEAQRYYPFRFLRADVLNLKPEYLRSFDLIWSSPPCQRFSTQTNAWAGRTKTRVHWNLIPRTRRLLVEAGVPSIIENVPTAPMRNDLLLCGAMFGLRLIRHRIFECRGFEPARLAHRRHDPEYITVTGHGGGKPTQTHHNYNMEIAADVMGIDWLPRDRLVQAIPPAYGQYIGEQAFKALNG
jgi:DNA (cytosine-5)-methyltransferase 1